MGSLRRIVVGLVMFASLTLVRTAHAQAVIDEKGTVSAALSFDYGFANKIVETGGVTFENQHVNTQVATLALSYVPVNRLAISVALPLVGVKYDPVRGQDPHGPWDGTIADGSSTHYTLQDLRADAAYMVIGGGDTPYALAFHVGLTAPLADYPVQGYAAPGRHLFQGRIGVDFSISPQFLPRAFFNVGYELTLSQKFEEVEETKDVGQTRSVANASLGYFITDKFGAYLLSGFRTQHDGVNLVDYSMFSAELKAWHDPVLDENALLVGLGAMYALTEKLYISATYSHFVSGKNTLNTSWLGASVGWAIR
ncbi:MAG: hypothetical protein SFX73_28845 [Kofleriaceae bacterium]|nr:hypothetical protein [Kofleriaceae bacterium]